MINFQELLKKMTLAEKIGQLTQYNGNLFLDSSADVTGPMRELGLTAENLKTVGSVLNFRNAQEMKLIQDAHLAADPNGIPIIFMMDVIHGYRTIYPIPLGLACSWDPALSEECAAMAAREAAAAGVQVTFAPMVDYCRDPRWGRVMETGGEEPLLTGAMAAAQVRGFQGEDLADPRHLATCVKHYAGYGGAEAGRDYNLVEVSNRELRQFYLPAYKDCLDAGAPMVMPSFNSLNGVPSTVNDLLMKQILRQEWGFDGVVISDYNAIGELIPQGIAADEKQAARLAFDHGCDMEMCSPTYIHHLGELIDDGVFSQDQLDEAVLRVLKLKQRLGLFDDPYHGADDGRGEALYLSPAHRAIARKAAEESGVLLKNDGLLPLSDTLKKVAVIGPFAQEHGINGFWSCAGRDEDTVTMTQGIRERLPQAQVKTLAGCSNQWDDRDDSQIPAAVALARESEAVILCLGEPQDYSGEGNCRTDLRLPGLQEELARQVIAANPNTVVVLFNGRPLDLSALDEIAPAILELWFPGTEGGRAAAALLFGDANPCGKLTMSFPRSVGQCPIYYNHPNTGRPHWTASPQRAPFTSSYIGCGTLPLYPFGHGLSYARFVYEDLRLSDSTLTAQGKITATVTLRNDSEVAGQEVVQLYIRDLVASVVRPVQQLIAFRKVGLAPGETQTVTFTIEEPMLRFWTQEGTCISEPGDFRLMVGCPENFRLTGEFTLQ